MPTIITRGAGSAVGFGLFGSSAVTDPYFFYNTLLLPGNGTNGAQNNTFLDSSTNNFTITRNGNTTQGTFTPYGSNWSNYFDGSGDSLTAPSGACISGTGDFTAECWIFPTTVPGSYNIIGCSDSSNGLTMFGLNANGTIFYGRSGVSVQGTTSNSLNYNTWNHIAISRSSSTLKMFINGVQGFSGTETYSYASGTVRIGTDIGGSQLPYTGYISNFRIIQGSALYTSNFTPSTTPLTAISGTSLLTCQSNRFIDNSSNAFTITRNGDTSVQRFSPFNPSAPYAAGTIGGSGYFDGSGDSLSLASGSTALPTGTQDFCVEMWLYWQTQGGSYPQIISNPTTNGFQIYYDVASGLLAVGIFNVSNIITYTIAQTALSGAWTHLAVTRSGNTFRMFVNGVLRANGTNTISFASLTTQYIASDGSRPYTGYMSDVRTVLGSIPTSYQTSSTTNGTSIFTPTSAPLTTSSQGATSGDVELLCLFTNGGIIDNAMMNDLETVGNAQISTTQSKFGGGSILCSTSSDYLRPPNSLSAAMSTGDFTIEFWFYASSLTTLYQPIIDTRNTGTSATGFFIGLDASGKPDFYTNGADRCLNASAISTGQWYHIAVCRASGSTRLFINGVQGGSTYTDANNYSNQQLRIGTNFDASLAMSGYIDDLRITKGIARYTSNFTPPTAAFPLS